MALKVSNNALDCDDFLKRYDQLEVNETGKEPVVVYGRTAGSKLIFFDLVQDGHKVQVVYNLQSTSHSAAVEEFAGFRRLVRRGDVYSVTGKPHRTPRGELSIKATGVPKLLAPCLHAVPVDAHAHEDSPYDRHVQLLADKKARFVVQCRSHIIQYIRQFLLDRTFLEVDTPILASDAGGAIAKPFQTSATEFPERQLSLRIAPELWLKRMVVGGLDKVFEIGPSFRNEGLDKTHNPEFTTCEFYHAYADLEKLLDMTETLLSGLSKFIHEHHEMSRNKVGGLDFSTPFRRIDFIPGIEEAIGRTLPNLQGSNATSELLQIFNDKSLTVPANPTLPRLLDKLCAEYLEPQCQNPTFIINPPECLSPLSKVFPHPTCNQRVAARGELFIEGKEIVNTYEEENSPVEQRRKFQEQLQYRDQGDPANIDESYLQALEWGLPPTGGWGCGIDRLCMLFTDSKRIGDVLPFGNLRAVTRQQGSREDSPEK
ncbi:hypothetical protein FQN54_005562 [Arachnomyces sp. PD_36]|nr:hypothetical protein FQN54_005562 [Arachnomyces sp. PD_36]